MPLSFAIFLIGSLLIGLSMVIIFSVLIISFIIEVVFNGDMLRITDKLGSLSEVLFFIGAGIVGLAGIFWILHSIFPNLIPMPLIPLT